MKMLMMVVGDFDVVDFDDSSGCISRKMES